MRVNYDRAGENFWSIINIDFFFCSFLYLMFGGASRPPASKVEQLVTVLKGKGKSEREIESLLQARGVLAPGTSLSGQSSATPDPFDSLLSSLDAVTGQTVNDGVLQKGQALLGKGEALMNGGEHERGQILMQKGRVLLQQAGERGQAILQRAGMMKNFYVLYFMQYKT